MPGKSLILEKMELKPGHEPIAENAAGTVNGLVIDRLKYQGAYICGFTGAVSGTPTATSVTFKVQHGDESDLSDAVDYQIDGVDVEIDEITAADSQADRYVSLKGAKRYIRLVATIAFTDGTTPAVYFGSAVALGDPNYDENFNS